MGTIDPNPSPFDLDAPSADELNVSESLVPAREYKTTQVCDVTFDGLLENPLFLKEDMKGGCGGQMWMAGMVLAKYLLRHHRSSLSGKTMYVLHTHFPLLPSARFF